MSLRARIAKSASVATGFVNLWASLIALGLAPTIAAVAAVVLGIATGALGQALLVALALSIVVNLLLLVIAIRAKSYSKALEADMELIGNMMRERRQPAAPWLPDANGHLPVSNADFERCLEDALAIGRTIGPDARLGVGWIDLSTPNISLNGFTVGGQKRFRVWCDPKNGCNVVQLERSSTAVYPLDEPQWRTDSSWADLVKKAWTAEAPFDGHVLLWPRRDTTAPSPAGMWRAEFRRVTTGVVGRPTSYVLVNGELHRLP